MSTLLIRNGHVIDPLQGIDEVMDIIVSDSRIAQIGKSLENNADKVVDATGMTVTPGLVDMHVHLRDPGFTQKEDIFTGCNAAVAGGVTSVLCMPNTDPVIDNEETIRYVMDTAMRAKARVNICGSATVGQKGDTLADYKLYKSYGIRAVSDDGRPIENEKMMKRAMSNATKAGLLLISHCEDLEIINGGIMHDGEVSKKLGVKGMSRMSEDNITARELFLAQQGNLRIHIAHVSTKLSTELIRTAKERGVQVTAETCPHYFAYTHEKLASKDSDYRMNPPLREQEDLEAVIEGIKDGTFDCIVTDHAPHTKSDKTDFLSAPNGVIGMETSLAAGIKFLVEPGHISLYRLIELMSTNPAKILGINAGGLKVGMPADIVVFNADTEWTVLPERMLSKSKNAVFKFEKLKGKVKYTFVGGEFAFVQKYN